MKVIQKEKFIEMGVIAMREMFSVDLSGEAFPFLLQVV